MPRPRIVGVPSIAPAAGAAAGADTRTITTPSGATPGETLLAVLTCQTQTASDVGLPAGWERIGLPAVNSSTVRVLGFFRHILTADPETSYTFNTPASGGRFGGMMLRIADAHDIQPIATSPSYGALASKTVTVPSVYAPTNEALYLVAGAANFSAGVPTDMFSGPVGMTLTQSMVLGTTTGSLTPLWLWQMDNDEGVLNSKTFVWLNAPGQSASNGIVIRGAGTAPAPPPTRVHIVGSPSIVPGPNTSGTATNLILPTPAGTEKGDSLLACLTCQATTPNEVGLPPGDWARIGLPAVNNATVRFLGFFILHLDPAGAPPEAQYVFSSPNPTSRFGGMLFRLRNAYAVQPQVAAATYGTMTGTAVSIPGISVTADDSMMITIASGQFTAGQTAAPATQPVDMTLVGSQIIGLTTGSRTPLYAWTQNVETGVVSTKSFTWASPPAQSTTNSLVLGVGIPPPTPGWLCQEKTPTGTRDVQLNYFDGLRMRPVMNVVSLPTPNRSRVTIADMDADEPFYWAHRGGSANWVEMTLRAYTNSVFHGCKSMEVSLQRTIDGVFVMHHDSTTLRMTGVNITISAAQWDLIKALTQTGNGQPPEKLQRFEEYLNTYGATHQTIIEDKTYNNIGTMLDLVESYYGRAEAVQRYIIKFYGVTTPDVVNPATSRGYKTWGYFYNDEAVTSMPTKATMFDYLGLNFDATQANWDAALAYGKPVVAHIVPSQAAATMALTKGAHGLQVSNVVNVIPRLNTLP